MHGDNMECPICKNEVSALIHIIVEDYGKTYDKYVCFKCLNDTVAYNSESLRSFALRNNLQISVKATFNPETKEFSWKCQFKGVEVDQGGFLKSEFGVGLNPDEAMSNYASIISCKDLVYHAYSKDKRKIHAGHIFLWHTP